MILIDKLLNEIQDGKVIDVRIGAHWTAVAVEINGVARCGLASTLSPGHDHNNKEPDVPLAGQLHTLSSRELVLFSKSGKPLLTSIGVAAVNALLPKKISSNIRDINAEHVIAEYGAGKNVAIIGRFPFVNRLKSKIKNLFVIEMNPEEKEYSPQSIPEILPKADVVAITGMTLINNTFDTVFKHCSPDSIKLMLGPSTPIHPVMFEQGIDLLSGSIVEDVESVLYSVSQGANFKQVHTSGVRLITIARPGLDG